MPVITSVLSEGTLAARPAATASNAGYCYIATDVNSGTLYQSTGSSWVQIAAGVTQAPTAHEASHLLAGSDPIAGLDQTQIAVDATEAATNDSLVAGTLKTNMRRLRYQLAQLGTGAWNTLVAMVQLSPASQQSGTINVTGEIQGSDFKPGGVTGATAAARYHAATATGHPTTGTWALGDIVPDQTGTFWFCTVAGTPGTWVQVGGTGGGGSSTLAGDTDVAISSPVGGQVLGYSGALAKWVNQNMAGLAATTSMAQLGADVTMTSANTFYDGPSVTVPPGTWLLCGTVTLLNAAATDFTAKLWDGTTVYASAEQARNTAAHPCSLAVSAVVSTLVTQTYKISVAGDTASSTIKAAAVDNASGNTASTLSAIQLSGNPVGQTAPAVRAYNSANISIPGTTLTALTFDTNRYDQGSSVSQHSTSVNTSRLTCQQAGLYQITGNIRYAASPSGAQRFAGIRLNGSTFICESDTLPEASTNTDVICTTQYLLSVGDYVELIAFQDSGGALNALSAGNFSPEFMMARIDSGSSTVLGVTTQTANYTIPSVQTLTIVGAASKTMTLPTAVNAAGQSCIVKNNGSGTSTTVATTASQTIDGASTYSLASAYQSVTLISDGANWFSI